MRWLRLVGSFKIFVSFAEYGFFHGALFAKEMQEIEIGD